MSLDNTSGDTTTSSSTTHRDASGQVTHKSYMTSTTDGDTGETKTGTTGTVYNDDGTVQFKGMSAETTDAEGNVIESRTMSKFSDGTSVLEVTDADGNTTTTKRDKDGNIISEETTDAKGNPVEPPEEGSGNFWDYDLITFGPRDLEPGQSSFEAGEVLAAAEFDHGKAHEMMADTFDFM